MISPAGVILVVFAVFLIKSSPVVSQCGSTHRDIDTTAKTGAIDPTIANRGVPFFPECEPDNRKSFRVKSETDVALFLSSTPKISDATTNDYYRIEVKMDGNGVISRRDSEEASSPLPESVTTNFTATDFVDLYVQVDQNSGTLHLGVRKDGFQHITSWQDPNLLDVNYILIQGYNGAAGTEIAEWEFCDGAVSLLTDNYDDQAGGQIATANQQQNSNDPDEDSGTADKAINGVLNGADINEFQCQILEGDAADITAGYEEFAWWRVDLKDFYNIKAVTILNAQGTVCPEGWSAYVGTCYRVYTPTTKLGYTAANTACGAGAHLATVSSSGIQVFLEALANLGDRPYWIDLDDMTTEGTFVDSSSTTIWTGGNFAEGGAASGLAYTNWPGDNSAPGFIVDPGVGGDGSGVPLDCVAISTTGAWVDLDCTDLNNYICEIAPDTNVADELVGAEVRVGSCIPDGVSAATEIENIKKNDVCSTSITSTEAAYDNDWIFKECDTNYYGRYVYILKEDVGADATWFSTCEVEVWGQEIPDADKPKFGFTEQVPSELENDFNTKTFTVMRTGGSAEHPTCCSFSIGKLDGLTPTATGPGTTVDTHDYDHASDLPATTATTPIQYDFDPTDNSKDFTIDFIDDFCIEEDEKVGFEITDVCTGSLIGDASHATTPTYETITFTIENDDVRYYWEDLTLSDYEGSTTPGTVMGVLRREGYLGAETTAYVHTAQDGTATEATSSVDFFALAANTPVVFPQDATSMNVVLNFMVDDDCETVDETFNLILDTKPEYKISGSDTVMVTIRADDVIFKIRNPNPGQPISVSETQGTREVVVEKEGFLDADAVIGVQSQPTSPSVSATEPEDYTAITTVTPVTIATRRTTGSVTVTVADDSEVEDDKESFELALVLNSNTVPVDACLMDSTVVIDIEDNDCNWSMTSDIATVEEDNGPAEVTIQCARDPASTVTLDRPLTATIRIDSSGVTAAPATSTADFTTSGTNTRTVTLPASGTQSTSATITIPIIDDNEVEPVEYFDVKLENTADGVIVAPVSTRVAITDDDALVKLATCGIDNKVLENANRLIVTLERTGDLNEQTSVVLFTNPQTATSGDRAGDGDYISVNKMVTFPENIATLTEEITINNDTIHEQDETFTVRIRERTQVTSVDSVNDLCIVTITDDDCSFTLSGTPTQVTEGSSVSVTVTKNGYLDTSSEVMLTSGVVSDINTINRATAGDDFESFTQLLVFGPGESSKTVDILVLDDYLVEKTEKFQAKLSGSACAIGVSDLVITILDNDEVNIGMQDATVTVVESDGFAEITLVRSGPQELLATSETVTLQLIPLDVEGVSTAALINRDFDNSPITVTFLRDQVEQTVRVPIFDDDLEEDGLRSFKVIIREIRQPTDATINSDARETIVYIRDDDGTFRLGMLGDAVRTVSEGDRMITCTVYRTGSTDEEETAYISTRNGRAETPGDYRGLDRVPLVFGQGVTSRMVDVVIYDDTILEPPENFELYLTDEDGNDLGQAKETIIEDNDNVIRFVGAEGCMRVDESVGTFTVTINIVGYNGKLPSGAGSVLVTSREVALSNLDDADPADGNGVDFLDVRSTVNFLARQDKVDVEVTINDDEIPESKETFELVLSDPSPDGNNALAYPFVISICINDDDGGTPGDVDEPTDDEGSTVSNSVIVGIGGGIGLLLMLGVLGLVGCLYVSRTSTTRAAPRLVQQQPIPRRPLVQGNVPPPPPPYYIGNNYPQDPRYGIPQGRRGLRY
ncbi:uncharacterized protein [Amphiura filiformis]|uniref:uncharacterized protein isoform X2 n=1 Tax=Amphiura filiformis TaxID=82378 RepID=UPI003B211BAA